MDTTNQSRDRKKASQRKELDNAFVRLANLQAASVLLSSTFKFLIENGVSEDVTRKLFAKLNSRHKSLSPGETFSWLAKAYDEMGNIFATWFDSPKFLNPEGKPIKLSLNKGKHSFVQLMRAARARLSYDDANALLKHSPSVEFLHGDEIVAVKRVFELPGFNVSRAALVVPHFYQTLLSNTLAHKVGSAKLLERQCSAKAINAKSITSILRNVKDQGTAFVDSIDGQIELARSKKSGNSKNIELGLLVFAWTTEVNSIGQISVLEDRRPFLNSRSRRNPRRQNTPAQV